MADRHKHPQRGIRVPDERWEQATEKAKREGRTITEVVNEELEKYVRRPDHKKK
jgi:predicted DNA-binding protein